MTRAKSKQAQPAAANQPPLGVRAHPLTGRFAHTFAPCAKCGGRRVQYQLRILEQVGEGVFLAQLYEWLMGYPGSIRMFSLSQMIESGWEFYDSQEQWTEEYNHKYARLHKKCDDGDRRDALKVADSSPLARAPMDKV